jgi:hypothetical protein
MGSGSRCRSLLAVCAWWLTASALLAAEPQPGDWITLKLEGGRSFRARIDARTSDRQLWLRFGNESVTVLRPVAWEAVAAVEHEGQQVAVNELRRLAAAFAAEPPRNRAQPVDDTVQVPRAAKADASPPRVTSLDFDVYTANWDADAEVDGLVIHVRPLDGDGKLAAVSGTLVAELLGPPGRNLNTPRRPGHALRRLGLWSNALHAETFAPDGYAVRLPFQGHHPEFTDGAWPYGLVQLRLTVPGQGVFAASCDGVRLRPYAPLRDWQRVVSGE